MLNNDILHCCHCAHNINGFLLPAQCCCYVTVCCVAFGRMACGCLGTHGVEGQIKVFPGLGNFKGETTRC